MQTMNENSGKRPYTAPRLTVHGTLEDITKQSKNMGAQDGVAYGSIPIGITS